MTIGANKIVILTIFTGLCAATIGAIFVYMYCKKEQDPAPAPESQINQHLPNNERDHNSERVEKSTENESSEVSGGKNWQISLGGHKKSRKNINERNLALNGSPITPRAEQPDQVLHEGEQSNSHLVEKFSSVGGYNEKRDITTQFRGHTENLHYHVIFDSKLSLKDFILKLREYKNFHDDTISNKIICSDEINVNNVLFEKLRRYATSRRFLEFFKFQENILQKLFKSYDMVENVLKKCEAYGLKTIEGTNDESTKMIYNYIGEVGGFIFNEINEIFLTGDDCLEAIGRMDSTALHEFAEEFSETLYRMLVEEKISDYNILRVAISCHFESFLAAFREKICPKPPQNFHVCSGIRIRILKMMAYDILSRALPDDLRKICFIMNNIIKITLEYEFFRARTIGVLLQLYKISEIDKKEDMTEEDSLQLFEGIKLHVESFEEFLKRSVVVLKSKVEIKQADVPNPANVNVPEIEDVGDKNEYGFGHSDQLKELILEGKALIPASQINHLHNIQTGNPSLELGNDTKLGDNVRSGLKPIEPAPEKKNNINMLVDDYISEVEGYKNFSDEIIRKKMTCFHINRNLVAEMDAMREYAQSQQGFLKLFMSKENLMLEIITSRENVMDILAQFKKLNNINVGEISKILSREIIPLQNVISNSISQIISSKKVLLEKIKKMNNKGFQKFVELLGQKFEKNRCVYKHSKIHQTLKSAFHNNFSSGTLNSNNKCNGDVSVSGLEHERNCSSIETCINYMITYEVCMKILVGDTQKICGMRKKHFDLDLERRLLDSRTSGMIKIIKKISETKTEKKSPHSFLSKIEEKLGDQLETWRNLKVLVSRSFVDAKKLRNRIEETIRNKEPKKRKKGPKL